MGRGGGRPACRPSCWRRHDGRTPAHSAAANKHDAAGALQALLDTGCPPAALLQPDDDGATPEQSTDDPACRADLQLLRRLLLDTAAGLP